MSTTTGAEPQGIAERVLGAVYDGAWGTVALAALPLAACGASRWRAKLGFYPPRQGNPRCWIHACSVGEVRVALRCMDELRRRKPDLRFTLSTVTPEGYAAARAGTVDGRDDVVVFPFDARSAMRRAFERLAPDFVILTEVELWPNHLREAAARGVPVFVVNARLTVDDERNYRKAGRFMRRVFAVPELVCARGPAEGERFHRLGARNIVVIGDVKYETLAADDNAGERRSEALLLGASTHEGEERILLRATGNLRRCFPDLRLVLVPRHPRRAAAIAGLARREGFRASLSSSGASNWQVLVVDEIGRLAGWYGQATVCFVGKSLTARGGQNFLEAAAAGCPILAGPHIDNFREAADLFVTANAMVQVSGDCALEEAVGRLLSEADERQRMAAAAREILRKNRGAARRTADLIIERLQKRA
jgi:3-deoxy-D-manno-octulosonic-acid transferase